MIAAHRTLLGMTHKDRRDIAHLYGQTPHGVLCTLVDVQDGSYGQPGTRMYVTAVAGSAGSLFRDELLSSVSLHVQERARMQAGVLMEHGNTPEAEALMEACVASLAGELRIVATLLPEAEASLLRFVMDKRGDVLFASELLETEDIVPLRRFARTSAHGVIHLSTQGRLFVERMEAAVAEERIIENDTPYAEAE